MTILLALQYYSVMQLYFLIYWEHYIMKRICFELTFGEV